jgi:hypothetical protein
MRPLIDEAWREQNREKLKALWEVPPECPICCESGVVWEGPLNSDRPTRCVHWACSQCWRELRHLGDFRCPFCRDSVQEWQLDLEFGDNLEIAAQNAAWAAKRQRWRAWTRTAAAWRAQRAGVRDGSARRR